MIKMLNRIMNRCLIEHSFDVINVHVASIKIKKIPNVIISNIIQTKISCNAMLSPSIDLRSERKGICLIHGVYRIYVYPL